MQVLLMKEIQQKKNKYLSLEEMRYLNCILDNCLGASRVVEKNEIICYRKE